jgi:hypothetical protein
MRFKGSKEQGNIYVNALVDSGSIRENLMSYSLVEELGMADDIETKKRGWQIKSPEGPRTCYGRVYITWWENPDDKNLRHADTEFYIWDYQAEHVIMGAPFAREYFVRIGKEEDMPGYMGSVHTLGWVKKESRSMSSSPSISLLATSLLA